MLNVSVFHSTLNTYHSTFPSSLPCLLNLDLGSILQLRRDCGVAPGDDFLARLDAALDLDMRAVGDPGLDFLHADFVAGLDEDDALQFLAQLALLLPLLRLIGDVGAIVARVPRLLAGG